MKFPLAICIPTYNRADLLDEALASISAQVDSARVQVVISDNASTDATTRIVDKWRGKFASLVYFCWAENVGADRNFLKAVELSNAEYCWLLGSDDALVPGALQRVLSELGNDDIVLLDYVLMSKDMGQSLGDRSTLTAPPGSRVRVHDAQDLRSYLTHATALSGLFAYISVLVFRRRAWDSAPTNEKLIGSAWIHVAKLLDVFARGGQLLYPGIVGVMNRSDNDSFLAELGFRRRAMVDFGFVSVAETVLIFDKALRQEVIRWLGRKLFTWRVLLGVRLRMEGDTSTAGDEDLEGAVFRHFRLSKSYWPKIIAWRFIPRAILKWARIAHRAGR